MPKRRATETVRSRFHLPCDAKGSEKDPATLFFETYCGRGVFQKADFCSRFLYFINKNKNKFYPATQKAPKTTLRHIFFETYCGRGGSQKTRNFTLRRSLPCDA